MERNTKILSVVAVVLIFLVVVLADMQFGFFPGFSSTNMKNETFEGITVSVPVDANFTQSAWGPYDDDKLGLQVSSMESELTILSFTKTLDDRNDMQRIMLDGVPSGSICWKSDAGYTHILVVNSDFTRGMCVGAKDNEKLAIQMANSVIFPEE